jgi:outer membrane biosynthesis protein TonB
MKRFIPVACCAWLCAGSIVPIDAVAASARTNNESLQQLRLEKYVLPEFPEFVRQTGASSGIVTVAIGRNPEGYVDDVLVLDSTHPKLSYAVTTAVQAWRFARPANPAPPGKEIVPIVRFLFATSGVSVVSAVSGTAF